ncbi:MAG TPA: tRNA epoxyqueuosine(34) reductase QueG [Acidobacteriota bacterium]|nr:tRNA epoxyqueuosine(34) reductase QueG [Acidobacteriota bacterium]
MDNLTAQIRREAAALGFDAVGCAPVDQVPQERLREWLRRGYQGQMAYMERNTEKRLDPSLIVPGACSVLSLGLNYRHNYRLPYDQREKAAISRYASGDDYHDVLWERLPRLLDAIQKLEPAARGRYYVDTGPVMDKHWAVQSGLGWLGKHTNVLSRQAGSWFFLGEIILNIELDYDQPVTDHCGSCRACLEACPTDAIVEEYLVDARLCISYLTIELREDIPESLRPALGNLVFGCDICQDVCPWNSKAPLSTVEAFAPRPENRAPDLKQLSRLTPQDFSRRFRKSPVKRSKWRGFMRNVAVAMGNSGDPSMLPDLRRLASCGDELVERHAKWAIRRIDSVPPDR